MKPQNQPLHVDSTASGLSSVDQQIQQLQNAYIVAPDDRTRADIRMKIQNLQNRKSSQSFANPTLIGTPSGSSPEQQQLEQLERVLPKVNDPQLRARLEDERANLRRILNAQVPQNANNFPSTSLTPDLTRTNARPTSIVSAGSSRRRSISPVGQSTQNPDDEAAAIMGDPSLSEQEKNERLGLLFAQSNGAVSGNSQTGPNVNPPSISGYRRSPSISSSSSRRSSVSPVRESSQNPEDAAAAILGNPLLSETQKDEALQQLFAQSSDAASISSRAGPSISPPSTSGPNSMPPNRRSATDFNSQVLQIVDNNQLDINAKQSLIMKLINGGVVSVPPQAGGTNSNALNSGNNSGSSFQFTVKSIIQREDLTVDNKKELLEEFITDGDVEIPLIKRKPQRGQQIRSLQNKQYNG